ncbi:hypothetical protein PF007_g16931 [Phytophthora fragariae]|uniref:Myb/SANT-like domain-containing protein n=1 Tax=Phytophthora fragariae TaxID=53985 RepID=A0A6A3RGZ8_9STRA|nr:hypothetical protein PF007_g16931 [Phytophthora fragariae]
MSPLALIPATPVTFQGSVVSKAWDALVLALNAKHQRTLGKGQFKSKYTRLMQDCDLYKYLTGLSGVGICPDTSRRSMTMYGSTSCNRSRSRGQNCGHERARVPARYDLLRNHATWTTTTPATPAMEAVPCPRRTRPRRLRQASRKPLKSPQADAKSPTAISSAWTRSSVSVAARSVISSVS